MWRTHSHARYLDLNKLRNYARHGIQPQVRGEVWLYLLGVLAANKSQEMTTVRSKFLEYESFSKRIPSVEKLIRTEVLRYFRQRFHVHKGSPERFGLSVIRGPRSERGSYGAPKSEAAVLDCLSYPRILPSTQYGLLIMRSNPPLDDTQAVHAQRRLSQIVENVLCAYLNGQIGVQIREEEHTLPETKHDEDYASLQHQIESRMPHAYQWAPQASVVPGTSIVDFHPSLVYLCVPFAMCVRAEAGIYFAFARLMTMIEDYNRVHPLPHRVASFLTLFRTTLPELHTYFEAEEVDLVAVATSWLQHLLAREMQMDDLMRLWDTYFAVPDLLDLHLYVCLAILTNCKDALEDLDRSETTSMLFSLPPLDVDRVRTCTSYTQIISDATNIRLSLENDQLYE